MKLVETPVLGSRGSAAWKVSLLLAALALLILLVWWLGVGSVAPEPVAPSQVPGSSLPAARTEPGPDDSKGRAPVAETRSSAPASPIWASPCVVTGRTVDRRAKPVAGAKVALLEFRAGRGSEQGPSARHESESNSNGVFQFSVESGFACKYTIEARAARCLPTETEIPRLLPPSFNVGEIVLEPGNKLTCRVLDETGSPVGGAEIRMLHSGSERWLTNEVGMPVGRSGPDGTLALAGLPGDGVRLEASEGTRRSVWSEPILIPPEGATRTIELVLEPALLVRGRVIDRASGAPLRASVRISTEPKSWVAETESRADGEFSAWAARPSTVVICTARAPGYQSDGTGTSGGSPGSEVEFLVCKLIPLGSIDIVVEDQATKAPLADAELAWIPQEMGNPKSADPRLYDAVESSLSADERGRIHADSSPESSEFAVVRAPGHAPSCVELRKLAGQETHVQLSSGGTVQVIVMSASSPAPGVRVELYTASDWNTQDRRSRDRIAKDTRTLVAGVETDSAGVVRFQDLPATGYFVQVRDGMHASHPIPDVTVTAGQTFRVTIEVGAACSIEGRVSRDGRPAPAVVVVARDVDQHIRKTVDSSDGPYEVESAHAYTTLSDPVGRYRLEGLPNGIYTVTTLTKDLDGRGEPLETPSPKQVVLAEGQTGECDLELEATITFRGTVAFNGRPRYGVRVSFLANHNREDGSGPVREECLTDCDGHYALEVPERATGQITIKEGRAGGGADLAERLNLASSDAAVPIDFDIHAGVARLEFVSNGKIGPLPTGSNLILKPKPEGGGVSGFSTQRAWFLSTRSGATEVAWTLPAGAYHVYVRAMDGEVHAPESSLTVAEGESTTVSVETAAAK
jgi:hypothetical protein